MRPAVLALVLAIVVAAQPVPLDIYRPQVTGAPYPVVILVHGGDFTLGSRQDPSTRRLAGLLSQAGIYVFSIDYRMAPAHPFPAAVTDVQSIIQWVRAHTRD